MILVKTIKNLIKMEVNSIRRCSKRVMSVFPASFCHAKRVATRLYYTFTEMRKT